VFQEYQKKYKGRRLLVVFFLFLYMSVSYGQTITVRDSLPQSMWFGIPVGLYSEKTSWAFGLSAGYFFKTDQKNNKYSLMQLTGIYTLNNQIQFVFLPRWFSPNGKQIVDGSLVYERFPLRFYGVGSNSKTDSSEIYKPSKFKLEANSQWEVGDRLFAGVSLTYLIEDVLETEELGMLSRDWTYGVDGYHLAGTGLIVSRDKRENQFYPRSGSFQKFKLTYYIGLSDANANFYKGEFDFRNYFSLGGQRVIATQVFSQWIIGESPFQLLPRIGGIDVLRGYNYGRYSDNISIATQAEYRFHLHKRFFGALLGSVGNVYSSLLDFNSNNVKIAFGGGVRYKLADSRLNLRLDMGVNKDMETAFYITVMEAF